MEASALQRQRALLPRSRRLLTALGDDRLVDQVRRGNSAAFEVLYDRHYRGILSFCRHMLGSREEAEDALQQTFASAFTDLQANDRDIRLKAWLYTIARNRCLSMLRARREQPAELDDMPTSGLSEEVQQRADLRELLADLRELPEEQREALVLFELGDLSHAEVANVIGVEAVKVKALVFQARSSLIENREARSIPCTEIREQLATATGGALRRGPLRRHLNSCEGCCEYRDHVRAQRRAMALLLPVIPTAGLKDSVLAAIGLGGGAGGGGLAAGGAAGGAAGVTSTGGGGALGGGGLFAAIGGAGVAKVAVATAIGVGSVAGGGIAIKNSTGDGGAASQAAASGATGTSAGQPGGSGGNGPAPASERGQAGDREARDDAKDRDGKDKDRGGKDQGKDERGARGAKGGRSSKARDGRKRGTARSRNARGGKASGRSRGNGNGGTRGGSSSSPGPKLGRGPAGPGTRSGPRPPQPGIGSPGTSGDDGSKTRPPRVEPVDEAERDVGSTKAPKPPKPTPPVDDAERTLPDTLPAAE